MIPTLQDREWFVGIVGLHLAKTSEFGRRETEYIDSETLLVKHDSKYTLNQNPWTEPNSRSALMETVAEAICQTGYRPGRIRVTCFEHEEWLQSLSFLKGTEIIEDPEFDLDAVVEEDPPWRLSERPEEVRDASHPLARLHATAAQLRQASMSADYIGDVDFVFDIPAIGLSGSGWLDRDVLGLEKLYLSHFEVDPERAGPPDPVWEAFGLTHAPMPKSIEFLHITRDEASPLLQRDRADFMSDDDDEPYPIVELERNRRYTRDAGKGDVRVACLVAQGLAGFLDAEGKKLYKLERLHGDYEARWGDEVLAVRIIRPEPTP